MKRSLPYLVVAVAFVGCASDRSKERPVSAAPPPAAVPAPPPDAQAAAPAAPGAASSDALRQEAQAALVRAQARLDEATREEQFARSARDVAAQDLQQAQQEAQTADRTNDALARAPATEAVEAARDRFQVAEAHAAFAQRLVAARSADADASRAHAAVVEAQLGSTDPGRDARVADAVRAEEQARAHALELGQAAIAAQRQWHALAQKTRTESEEERARAATSSPAQSGTGSGATQGTTEAAAPTASEPVPTR